MSKKRLKKEYKIIVKHEKEIKVWLVDKNIMHWKAIIKGPIDTIYEKGSFQIDIKIPEQYPFIPPKMKYDTKIWHPNISS